MILVANLAQELARFVSVSFYFTCLTFLKSQSAFSFFYVTTFLFVYSNLLFFILQNSHLFSSVCWTQVKNQRQLSSELATTDRIWEQILSAIDSPASSRKENRCFCHAILQCPEHSSASIWKVLRTKINSRYAKHSSTQIR